MLPPRFLRHAPLLLVDSPAQESLKQIYGTFNSALLKLHPPLRGHVEGLTNAMIDFYHLNQVRFFVFVLGIIGYYWLLSYANSSRQC